MPRIGPWKLVATGAVLTALLGACSATFVTGRKEVSLVDAALSAYANSVGQRVAHVSHPPGPEWHLTVLDDGTVNTFARPGGYIYITRGILPYLNSKAQLDRLAHLQALQRRRAGGVKFIVPQVEPNQQVASR